MALALVLSGTAASNSPANQETGSMEHFSGEIRLNYIFASTGIIVDAGSTLVVDGDVNAGEFFICRGGTIQITGKLTAEVIYFDSAEAALEVEIGEVYARYYTQCGGTAEISGNIVARSDGEDDGLGIVNICSEYSANGTTSLTVDGGIFARGGDIRAGRRPDGDEASTASFFAVRGITIAGYEHPASGGSYTYIYTAKGLNATDGGTVYRDFAW